LSPGRPIGRRPDAVAPCGPIPSAHYPHLVVINKGPEPITCGKRGRGWGLGPGRPIGGGPNVAELAVITAWGVPA
jgi:hypothetical protein